MQIAAGAVLEKQTAQGPRVAVVFRDRYGPEWSLPKGKVEPGESWEEAARREVEEETNCVGRIISYAGVTDYLVAGAPKIVSFWHMVLEKEDPFQTTGETKDLRWQSPREAFQKLTHRNQAAILAKVYALDKDDKQGRPLMALQRRSKRWQRLASAIRSYQGELPGLKTLVSPPCPDCFGTIQSLLAGAQQQLYNGRIDAGWKLFQAARRMELISLCEPHQRRTRAREMLQEASKIKGWRGEAIKKLVESEDAPPTVEALYQAALVRDESFSNSAYKGALHRTHAIALAVLLAAVLLGLFAWFLAHPGLLAGHGDVADGHGAMNTATPVLLFTIGLFGLLGGTVSAIIAVPKSIEAARIPEMTTSFQVTFLRLFMGFASAIIIFVLLNSSLGAKILSAILTEALAATIKGQDPYSAYFIAFCAGFSERLVKRAAEYVAGK